jgi:hypothetical protein
MNIKKSFDIDGYKFYKTIKVVYRKAKLCTTEKSIIITKQEYMNAWDKHFELYYA